MITKDFLLSVGFKPLPHFTVGDSMLFDLGRRRHLSVGSAGTPNEVVFICQVDPSNPKNITDLVCLHNYDYDGFLTEDRVVSLLAWFSKSV